MLELNHMQSIAVISICRLQQSKAEWLSGWTQTSHRDSSELLLSQPPNRTPLPLPGSSSLCLLWPCTPASQSSRSPMWRAPHHALSRSWPWFVCSPPHPLWIRPLWCCRGCTAESSRTGWWLRSSRGCTWRLCSETSRARCRRRWISDASSRACWLCSLWSPGNPRTSPSSWKCCGLWGSSLFCKLVFFSWANSIGIWSRLFSDRCPQAPTPTLSTTKRRKVHEELRRNNQGKSYLINAEMEELDKANTTCMSDGLMKLQAVGFHEDFSAVRAGRDGSPHGRIPGRPIYWIHHHVALVAAGEPPQVHSSERPTERRRRRGDGYGSRRDGYGSQGSGDRIVDLSKRHLSRSLGGGAATDRRPPLARLG